MSVRVLVVEARYYEHISDALVDGAAAVLESQGAHFERITVPGALEIPTAIALAAYASEDKGHGFDGYVALGCVIRGDTYHFEIVASQSAQGLLLLGIDRHLCIGNGILTVDNEEQALVRARQDRLDKGGSAARACLALIELRARFQWQQ